MPRDDAATETDATLLERFAAGDPAAASVLVHRHLPRALRVASRLLRDRSEAEDVAQEAMLRLWRVAPDWRPGDAQVSTWLYRVVSNLCLDRLRRRGRSVPFDSVPDLADRPDGAPDAVEQITAADRTSAFETALGALPDRQRQAVVLRHLEGLSNPEIAAVMDIGVEAVESLTARGRRALAAALRGRAGELGYGDDG